MPKETTPQGSSYDQSKTLVRTYMLFFLIGGLDLLQSLAILLFSARSFRVEILPSISFAWNKIDAGYAHWFGIGALVLGAAYLVLAYFIRRRSILAAQLAVPVNALQGIFAILTGESVLLVALITVMLILLASRSARVLKQIT